MATPWSHKNLSDLPELKCNTNRFDNLFHLAEFQHNFDIYSCLYFGSCNFSRNNLLVPVFLLRIHLFFHILESKIFFSIVTLRVHMCEFQIRPQILSQFWGETLWQCYSCIYKNNFILPKYNLKHIHPKSLTVLWLKKMKQTVTLSKLFQSEK